MNENKETKNKNHDFFNNIKSSLKKPANLLIISIILVGLLIRVYYYLPTIEQPLWWDEAEYGSSAKNFAIGTPYDLNPQRPPLFQILWGILLNLGFSLGTIKLILVIIPSVFVILAIYLLGKEMYNETTGIISAFLASTSWTFLFWTSRLQPDFLSISFSILSVFFMWRYWTNPLGKKATKLVIFAGIFSAIALYFKVSALLIPLIFLTFILIREKILFIKNKKNWIFLFSFIITLCPYFIWAYIKFGSILAFTTGYSNQVVNPTLRFGWGNLQYLSILTTKGFNFRDSLSILLSNPIEGFISTIFLILFIIGLILSLKFILYIDKIAKKDSKPQPDFFSIISIIIISMFYIFYIRATEDRWVFLWMPFIFFLIGNSIIKIKNMIKNKNFITYTIFIILIIGSIGQISHANDLIEIKKSSYQEVKDAGIWIKDNSLPGDKVISASLPQTTYYSERHVIPYSLAEGEEDFNNILEIERPRYLQVSIFENHPSWLNNWIDNNQGIISPKHIIYLDRQNNQIALIVYEVNY